MTEQQRLIQRLQQELQGEQVVWQAFPDATKRAKQPLISPLTLSWISLRILLLFGTLIILFVTSAIYHSNRVLPLTYGGILLAGCIIVVSFGLFRRQKTLRQLQHTLYAITTRRLIVIFMDRDQFVQKSYSPSELGQIDLIERDDGWGDIVIGVHMYGGPRAVVSPGLSGVGRVREVATLLQRLQAEQQLTAPPMKA